MVPPINFLVHTYVVTVLIYIYTTFCTRCVDSDDNQ